MKYHVFIATTQGVVAIQDIIALDDPDIQSLITVNGTATLANISHHYHHFVKKGSGIIQQDFGCCSYRANIAQGIDQGSSWQLAMYIAHVLAEKGLLGSGSIDENDQVIIATGQINTAHRTILPVTKVAEKYQKLIKQYTHFLPKSLKEKPDGYPLFFIPQGNSLDINTNISMHHTAIKIEAFTQLSDVLTRINGLITQSHANIELTDKTNIKAQAVINAQSALPETDELNELEALLTTNQTESEITENEKGTTLKKHRNSLDETKEVESMLAGFMYKFNPKHIVSRIVGFCGFALFVIALILTLIKDEQSIESVHVDLQEQTDVKTIIEEEPQTQLLPNIKNNSQIEKQSSSKYVIKPQVNGAYLIGEYTENNDCQKTANAKLFVNKANNKNVFKAFNRHQLCQVMLTTNKNVSEVIWLDNNTNKVTALSKSAVRVAQNENEEQWNIPLAKEQKNDINYFLVLVDNSSNEADKQQEYNESSELLSALTHFTENDFHGLKLTQQDLFHFLTDYSEQKPIGFLLYEHTLEVF